LALTDIGGIRTRARKSDLETDAVDRLATMPRTPPEENE
jgi:hypothetical protein